MENKSLVFDVLILILNIQEQEILLSEKSEEMFLFEFVKKYFYLKDNTGL